ncbi:hypothetical protein ACGFZA_19685 [Streptomyces sp. NPDC048211]|uniref:hypothetical protein n=1 Tax=Streptomyces sp. NPDC048211 TaxID=3365516 RepID=UPI0037223843
MEEEQDTHAAAGLLAKVFRIGLAPERWGALEQRRGRLLGCGKTLDAVDLDAERLRPGFHIEWK